MVYFIEGDFILNVLLFSSKLSFGYQRVVDFTEPAIIFSISSFKLIF